MYEYSAEADFDELFDLENYDEDDEASIWDEAARPPLRRPGPPRPAVRTAPRGNAPIKRAPQGFATKAELDATARKLDARIATNSTALKTLDGRVRTAEGEVGKTSAALRKEIEIRKKQLVEVRKSADDSKQMAMMIALLNPLFKDDAELGSMLPFLVYGGALGGSAGGSSGGMFGGGDNNMMSMLMLSNVLKP